VRSSKTVAYLAGITCCALLLGAAPTDQFASGLWPGEGRPRFAAKTSVLVLRRDPHRQSPVAARVSTKPGASLEFDDTRYRTVRPGEVVAVADGVLQARNFRRISFLSADDYYRNAPLQDIPYQKGTSFEYLQYRAEGNCFVRLDGEIIETDICATLDDKFRLLSEPITEWWVRVVIFGKPKGWLLIDETTVQFLDRQF